MTSNVNIKKKHDFKSLETSLSQNKPSSTSKDSARLYTTIPKNFHCPLPIYNRTRTVTKIAVSLNTFSPFLNKNIETARHILVQKITRNVAKNSRHPRTCNIETTGPNAEQKSGDDREPWRCSFYR